jgi:hypothetical protein
MKTLHALGIATDVTQPCELPRWPEWNRHVRPMEELARSQRQDPSLQPYFEQTSRKQGRPPTIVPLWSEIQVPSQLVDATWMMDTNKRPDLIDAPRTNGSKDAYGFPTFYRFHALLIVVLGKPSFDRLIERYRFSSVQRDTARALWTQFDNKLRTYVSRRNRQVQAAKAAAEVGETLAPLSDDDDNEEQQRKQQQKRRVRKRLQQDQLAQQKQRHKRKASGDVGNDELFWHLVNDAEVKVEVHH